MPVNFGTERFDTAIDETINNIFAALCEPSRGPLVENLCKLERWLPGYYHSKLPSIPAAEQRGKEVYREFLQYLICYVCQTITERDPEALCIFLASLCPDMFHIHNDMRTTPSEAIVWSDPEGKYTALHCAEKAGFNTLLAQLMPHANKALIEENPDARNPLLIKFFLMSELKRELLTKIDMKLALHWGGNEQILQREWKLLLQSCPNYKTLSQAQRRITNQDVLAFNSIEVDDVVQWLEDFHGNVIRLIDSVRDPILDKSLIDQAREYRPVNADSVSDFICFLGDQRPYFASTFQRLVHESQDKRVLISPVTGKEIRPIADRSNSMPALMNLAKGILEIKAYVLVHNEINIEHAARLALPKPGHMSQTAAPVSPPQQRASAAHPQASPPQQRASAPRPQASPPQQRASGDSHQQQAAASASSQSHRYFWQRDTRHPQPRITAANRTEAGIVPPVIQQPPPAYDDIHYTTGYPLHVTAPSAPYMEVYPPSAPYMSPYPSSTTPMGAYQPSAPPAYPTSAPSTDHQVGFFQSTPAWTNPALGQSSQQDADIQPGATTSADEPPRLAHPA